MRTRLISNWCASNVKIRTAIVVVVVAASGAAWLWLRHEPRSAQQEKETDENTTATRLPPRGPSLRLPTRDASTSLDGAAVPTDGAMALGDAESMVRLRVLVKSAPTAAVSLARESMARFPNSPDAAERHKLLIDALLNLDNYREARGEAERMVNLYAGTPWAVDVERRTGAHPHVRPYVPSE
jgi:hypothetical protein